MIILQVEMPAPQPSLYERPPSVSSGEPLRSKVVVTHRSDILLEEQINNVKTCQEQLQRTMMELELSRGGPAAEFLQQEVDDLTSRAEQMLLVLKVNRFEIFLKLNSINHLNSITI